VRDADGKIEAFVHEIDDPVEKQHRHVDQGMRVDEIRNDWPQYVPAECNGSGDREVTGRQPCLSSDILLSRVEVTEHALCILQEPGTRLCEVHRPRRAVEQAHAKAIFQGGNRSRDSRRRAV